MSQQVWANINPNTTTGVMLASILTDFKDALMSGLSGTARPGQLQAGGMWIDTTNQSPPTYTWAFKFWTGTVDVEIFRLNVNSGFGGALTCDGLFQIQQISADTAGAYLDLIKQRLQNVNNGQVLSGDTIGEIQFVGRTSTSTDPVVGYVKWVATDDQTTLGYGGYLTFYSTPDATNAIAEHMRFITGCVETVLPHKLNSLRIVTQDVATASVIAQLSANKYGVEFTGSTPTSVQGINSGQNTREIVLHNRSSAVITLRHQDTGAVAADRLKLPGSADMSIEADGTVTLFYDGTDARWKLKATQSFRARKAVRTFKGLINDWTCPVGITKVLLTSYKEERRTPTVVHGMLDPFGNAYMWGANTSGQLGLGDVTPRSSPVAVLGGLTFSRFATPMTAWSIAGANPATNYALTSAGVAYAWGANQAGQLGLGDVVPRSSPVAVLGGIKFINLFHMSNSAYGISNDGTLYAWGTNSSYHLGIGDNISRSSPVAVLGGIKFDRVWMSGITSVAGNTAICGIDLDGNAYLWGGLRGKGGGGDGTVSPVTVSSPVAVLGGLKFKKLQIGTAAGGAQAFAIGLTKDGLAYSWGDNSTGCLGDGTLVSKSSPVAVLGGLTFTDIWVAKQGTNIGAAAAVYAMTEDGTLYAWGANAAAELGVGDSVGRSSPVAVVGGLKFSDLDAVPGTTKALTVDGSAYEFISSPVAVLGGLKFHRLYLYTGQTNAMAIQGDGSVYMWGADAGSTGELGNGTVGVKSSPVAVIGGLAHNSLTADNVASVDVTPGTTYRIFMPSQREARFGNVTLGIGLEKVTVEYDIRGN